jgi:hypothetical protein
MSDRVTSEWKDDYLDAFDANNPMVKKGAEAEKIYYNWAMSVYDKVENHSADQEKQNQGIDFTIYKNRWGPKGYTVDVKSQYYGKYFSVDNTPNGWLRNPKKISDRIIQVDVKMKKCVDYQRQKMIDYLDKVGLNPNNIDPQVFKDNNLGTIKIHPWDQKDDLPKDLLVFHQMNSTNLGDFLKKSKGE